MKNLIVAILTLGFSILFAPAFTKSLAINADGLHPDPAAILDLKATNKGLLIPRMSSAARLAISNTTGLLVYDTTTGSFWFNSGTGWLGLSLPLPVAMGK